MTRVCHMTSAHPWDDVRIFHKECRSLAASGFDVHLVACAPRKMQIDGVSVHAIQRKNGCRVGRMVKTACDVYRAARNLDAEIYHIHDPELIPYALLLKWRGKKVIYDAHEDVPRDILSKSWIPSWVRKPLSLIWETLENFAAKRLSSVVAATPHIAQRFVTVNPSTVDVNNFPIDNELTGQSGEKTKAPRTICYIGGISDVRGAFEMVRALEFVDATLILAGSFQSAELEGALRALPGWAKVDYRGVVSREGVAQILAESRIGLVLLHPLTNYIDALPVKMFEYMSAGLPVLASDFPLWRSILSDTGAGVCVNPLDPCAIAECISNVLLEEEQAQVMGDAGRRAVLHTFRWKHEADKLVSLYQKLKS
ncbi:glycosyltransferase family 4 protein [Ralstonia sp. RL]|uniref:glycosyltransferase family 4 protein n=1 Tax=Ralstonia sp. RL TaxID=1839756 RepID=UPI000ACBBF8F|nr:glycosyltransferase family 4 protein [Ralstonia sp. RL]